MRVLLVNYEYPTTTDNCGGGGQFTRLLRQHLEDRGHTVRILTDGGDSTRDPDVSGPSPGHYVTFPLRSARHLKRLSGWADVVNGHFSIPSSLLAPLLARETPLVVSVLGGDVYDPTRFQGIRPVADQLTGYTLNRADETVIPSSDMLPRVQQKYDVDPSLIHLGIDPSGWTWRERDTPDRVVTVARLVERKNLRRAIQSVAEARKEGYDVEYRIVGTGPLLEELRAEYDYDWLSLPGYVEDLQQEYDEADLFLLPSHHESFGLVFVEALACGLPVVTSDCGGQRDIVVDGVGLSGPEERTTEMLTEVLDNYESYQDATEGYVEERFSAAGMAREYEDLYQRTIA